MEEPTIRWEWHFSAISEPEVRRESHWFEPRMPSPTKEELARCPDRFRCFVCLQVKGKKKHFGGEVLGQRVCKECFPYIDEWDIGGILLTEGNNRIPAQKRHIPLVNDIWTSLVIDEDEVKVGENGNNKG
jgi:hypothetical protein